MIETILLIVKDSSKLMLILHHLAILTLRQQRRRHRITSNIGREEILSRDTTVHNNIVIHMTSSMIGIEAFDIFGIFASKAICESSRTWRSHDSVGMMMMMKLIH